VSVNISQIAVILLVLSQIISNISFRPRILPYNKEENNCVYTKVGYVKNIFLKIFNIFYITLCSLNCLHYR